MKEHVLTIIQFIMPHAKEWASTTVVGYLIPWMIGLSLISFISGCMLGVGIGWFVF